MSQKTLGLVDYGIGNIANVMRCLHAITTDYKILRISNPELIPSCDKIVLPGVGAFGVAMEKIQSCNIDQAIYEFVKKGNYLLGICLGAQLLFDTSYEFGTHKGLSLIQGEVVRFSFHEGSSNNTPLKIPHVGWNKNIIQHASPLLDNVESDFYLYFVHSYHIACDAKDIVAYCDYGIRFPSIVCKNNVFGIQAHPERSHAIGFCLMQNFIKL